MAMSTGRFENAVQTTEEGKQMDQNVSKSANQAKILNIINKEQSDEQDLD